MCVRQPELIRCFEPPALKQHRESKNTEGNCDEELPTLDECLFRTVLATMNRDTWEMLHLCLAWNRHELARDVVRFVLTL